ncbi:uncharacterized protein ISCGN_007272 [Ixodes scapularis]
MTEKSGTAAPHQTGPLNWYAVYIKRLCKGYPVGSQEILSDLCNTKSIFTSRKIDFGVGCTQSDSQQCQIFKDLKLWNEFLWNMNAELKEVLPGKLGVVPGSCDFDTTSDDQLTHASILLHWLLKEHRCIQVFELLEHCTTCWDMRLLGDALRLSAGIKRLKLDKFHLSRCFVHTLATLSKLEELELCLGTMSKNALAHLQLVLEEMPSLKSLKLDLRSMSLNKTRALLQALKCCAATSLCLNGSCLKLENGRAFAEFFAQNSMLKELTVDHLAKREKSQDVKPLFHALRTNKTLEKLCLPGCCLATSEARLLVQVVATNSTLKILQVKCTCANGPAVFGELIGSNRSLSELEITLAPSISELAASIRKNTTMKKLSVSCKYLTVQSTETFLDALAFNKSLELVRLGNISEQEPGYFHRLLEEKGLDSRVHYVCSIIEPVIYMSNRKSGADLRRTRPRLSEAMLDTVHHVCRQLARPHQFVDLSISLYHLDLESARLLAEFLSSTKVLKHVNLAFIFGDRYSMQGILEGLRCNKSLSSVALEIVFEEEDAYVMGALVKTNKSLREITVLSPFKDMYSKVIFELSEGLVDNYYLFRVETSNYAQCAEAVFKIKDIMRRNTSMLLDAVKFAMGSCTKKQAEAFELLFESDALVEKLQELAYDTDFEARERVKKRLQYLKYNFMTVAGVVKANMVCELGEKQETRLDQIAFDSWLKIRSYLKVRDIADEPVAL